MNTIKNFSLQLELFLFQLWRILRGGDGHRTGEEEAGEDSKAGHEEKVKVNIFRVSTKMALSKIIFRSDESTTENGLCLDQNIH